MSRKNWKGDVMNIKKRYEQLALIIKPLEEFDDYFSQYDEDEAKQALINFFAKFKNIEPDKYLDMENRLYDYYSFYINVLLVRNKIKNGQFAKACNELLSLYHYEFMLQKRIYSALIELYNTYLGGNVKLSKEDVMPSKKYKECQNIISLRTNCIQLLILTNNFINNKSIEEKLDIINYLIKSIMTDVCTSVIVTPVKQIGELKEVFPLYYYDKYGGIYSICTNKKVMVNLDDPSVYIRPYDNKNIGKKLIDSEQKHLSYWYSDINLCYLYNDNNSINTERGLNNSIIYAEECKMELLYPHWTTDGWYWCNKHNGTRICNVSDFRLAAVYSLAQMRYSL